MQTLLKKLLHESTENISPHISNSQGVRPVTSASSVISNSVLVSIQTSSEVIISGHFHIEHISFIIHSLLFIISASPHASKSASRLLI